MHRTSSATPPTRRIVSTSPTPSLISHEERVVGSLIAPPPGGRARCNNEGVVICKVARGHSLVKPSPCFEGVSCCVDDATGGGS